MKTSLKTVLSSTLTAIVLATTVFTSTAAEKVKIMEHASVNPEIGKIIVTGNTKVILVQSYREWVTMDDDMLNKVSVKQQGNTLTINSSEESPVTVTVYVRNPFRIDASDRAEVKTEGKFNVKYLQVMLKDDAIAHINTHTEGLYTVVNDQANLELVGSTDNHIIKAGGLGTLKMDRFAALNTNRELSENGMAVVRIKKTADKK